MNTLAVPTDRGKGWYLSLMAPNTKGPKFAWLDPSRLYYCVKDLLCPFRNEAIALVAGVDAMGFIYNMSFLSWWFSESSVSTTLGKGFLKAEHLCIQIQSQEYSDYSGREKMEVHLYVLSCVLQVLIVDQWIETGGTMKAAIKLVERQGATVVGQCVITGSGSRRNTSSHCIPEELQIQIDKQYLDSFQELCQLNAQTQCHAVPSRVGNL
uniref:adenine phosphoribosyltransferase n=1 Tax=Salmo trutta TaxID=8032 RepID=A0A674EJZ1_SALTR